MKLARSLYIVFAILIVFSMLGTVASTVFHIDPGPVAPISGLLMILAGASAVALWLGRLLPVVILLAIGTVAEIVGLYTGFPFGHYEYTEKWWPVVPLGADHRFPLLLPFAWLLIVGGSYLTVRPWLSGWRAVFATAAVAALIDIPMERVMTDVLGYWKWTDAGPLYGAPILNTIGWFTVSLAGAAAIYDRQSPAHSQLGDRSLGFFCGFAAVAGISQFLDSAFLLLGMFAIVLIASSRQRSGKGH